MTLIVLVESILLTENRFVIALFNFFFNKVLKTFLVEICRPSVLTNFLPFI